MDSNVKQKEPITALAGSTSIVYFFCAVLLACSWRPSARSYMDSGL